MQELGNRKPGSGRIKICVLGLDGASPELAFSDERLVNLRRLMDLGVYGSLQSVTPPEAVPAWMSMTTSQDPGSLAVYGLRNRIDHSYDPLVATHSASIEAPAIWKQIAEEGGKLVLVGVPPSYPPPRVNGISVGCLPSPAGSERDSTFPPEVKDSIRELVGEWKVDGNPLRSEGGDGLKEEIFEMSRKQWQVVDWLLREQEWGYFHFVDLGLDRIQHGFWDHLSPDDPRFRPGNADRGVVARYYRWLDEQIGVALELLEGDTIVLVVSGYGAQSVAGGFAVNEWLVREGILVLEEYPALPTPFEKLKVNWGKTRAWAEGGACARIFFNLAGREPRGVIAAAEYDSFRDGLKKNLESLSDPQGKALEAKGFRPEELYREVRGSAPDLVVEFGALAWRSVASVGHAAIYLQDQVLSQAETANLQDKVEDKEQDRVHDEPGENLRAEGSSRDLCNPARHGMFILAAPNCPLSGEYHGAHLLDIAPTLLELGGYQIPEGMQGRSLVAGIESSRGTQAGNGSDAKPEAEKTEAEKTVLDRLRGLGYV